MSSKHNIKFLIESFVNELLSEGSKAQPATMYHGTSSKFLPKIFQLGIIPNPSAGKWKDDELEQKATVTSPSLRSLKGSYWTDNLTTAAGAARDSARTQGGEPTIVIAQIVPQSGFADEDDVKGPMQRAFRQALIPYFGHRDPADIAWPLRGLHDARPDLYKTIAGDFAEILHKELKASSKMPIDKKMLSNVFRAIHERLLGHIDPMKGRTKWAYFEAYENWLAGKEDWETAKKLTKEKIEKTDIPKFNKVSGEKNFLNALELVTKRYKKSALPSDEFRIRTNLRITEPVGFSGRNKITSILVGDKTELKLVYGDLPQSFIKDWSSSWGPSFRITDKKSGKEIHNTMKENKNIEEILTEKMALKSYGSFCQKVADAYDELPEYDPEAVASYKALISHIEKMYKQMLSKVKVEFVPGQPYTSQKEMAEKVKETGVLEISSDHNQHSVFSPEQNMKFRAVHDYIVHILSNVDFSDKGEVAAFNAHARLLPQKAIPAAFTEIVGQACYYHSKGSFPKQKIAIMKNFDFRNVGKIKGHEIKDKELVESSSLMEKEIGADDVAKLPIGSIVLPALDSGGVGDFWVVNKGKVILPSSVLPQKADGHFPEDGEEPGIVANEFLLVKTGKGKLPTHGTAKKLGLKYLENK